MAENQKTYVVQPGDAGNYILAELETAEGVYKCQSQQVKLVPQDYFGPRLVYWRDEEAAVDQGGTLGVLLKDRPGVLQYRFRWLVGQQEIGTGQFIQLSRYLSGKRIVVSVQASFLRPGAEALEEDVGELELNPGTMQLIVNRAPNGQLNDGVREEIEKHGLKLLGVLPQDETVYEADCEGKPSAKVPENSPIKAALREMMKKLQL